MSPSSAQRTSGARSAQHEPSATHDWSQWVDVNDAARLMNVSSGHLRRVCVEKLQPIAKAIYTTPQGGGQPRWFVHRSHDKRLGEGYQDETADPDILIQYTNDQIDGARKRRECVKAFREMRSREKRPQKDWLPGLIKQLKAEHDIKVSRSRLFEWDKALENLSDWDELIDTRGGNNGCKGDRNAWKFFQNQYLNSNAPKLKAIWQLTDLKAKRKGWQWCSQRSCRRQLNTRIPPERQAYYRNREEWRRHYAPSEAREIDAHAAGCCWESDHKQLDLWCRSGKHIFRPWITVFKDWRTRKVVGWHMSMNPCGDTILFALRNALEDESNKGGPDMVRVDNGKDFASYTFHGETKAQRQKRTLTKPDSSVRVEYSESVHRGLYSLLDIDVHFALPYNSTGKARIERWFRTTDNFARTFITFCGTNVSERKPELPRILSKEQHKIPSLEHVRDRFSRFVDGFNATADHTIEDMIDESTGKRLSPNDALNRWCPRIRKFADPKAISLLHRVWAQPTRAGRQGVPVKIDGKTIHYGAFDPNLIRVKAKAIKDRPLLYCSYDPSNHEQINVHDDKMRYLFTLEMNGKTADIDRDQSQPIGRDVTREYNKRKREREKALKVVKDTNHYEYETQYELMSQIAKEQSEPDEPNEPTPNAIRMVQTPVDGQHEQIKRKAAGAEAFADLDDDDDLLSSSHHTPKVSSSRSSDPFADLDDDDPLDLISTDDNEDDPDVNVDDGEDTDVFSSLKFPTDAIEEDDDDDVHFLDLLQ